MGMPPIMDGHREEQLRTANPSLQWLRSIALAVIRNKAGEELSASMLAEIGTDEGIDFPPRSMTKENPSLIIGRIMFGIYKESEGNSVKVDGVTVSRIEREGRKDSGDWGMLKFYTFTR
jgi:hypothetical protein